mmetsp:Transcript_8008/g.19251  ORF Transcript_8008/g.19251 Transcript_8008/m.19251 type:complete len:402 (+) Transcript_8008:428-1633(+)
MSTPRRWANPETCGREDCRGSLLFPRGLSRVCFLLRIALFHGRLLVRLDLFLHGRLLARFGLLRLAKPLFGDQGLPLLYHVLLQLAMPLDLMEVHLAEEFFLVSLFQDGLCARPLLVDALEALDLCFDPCSFGKDVLFLPVAHFVFEVDLLHAALVDVLEQPAPGELLLFPLVELLLPLPLLLLVLQPHQLRVRRRFTVHVHLEFLVKLEHFFLLEGFVSLLLFRDRLLFLKDGEHELFVHELVLCFLFGCFLLANPLEFVDLFALLLRDRRVSLDKFRRLALCIGPLLAHLGTLQFQNLSLLELALLLEVYLLGEGSGHFCGEAGAHFFFPDLALDFRMVTFLPQRVVNRAFSCFLGVGFSFFLLLDATFKSHLELEQLRVLGSQLINPLAPLLVQLLFY